MLLLSLLGGVGLGVAALVVVVRRRSLSGFQNGFLLTLALVLAGTAALSAGLVGVWLYRNAEQALIDAAVSDLRTNARLVESAALRDINLTIDQMGRVAEGIGTDLQRHGWKDIELALRTFHRVDPMFVGLDVVDSRGRLLGSLSHWETRRNDDVDLQTNQFGDEVRGLFVLAPSVLNDNVLPLHITELAQSFPESIELKLGQRVRTRAWQQNTHPGHLPRRLLRSGRERRCDEPEDEGDDELKSAGLHGGSVGVLPKQIKNTVAGLRLALFRRKPTRVASPARREIGWKATAPKGTACRSAGAIAGSTREASDR